MAKDDGWLQVAGLRQCFGIRYYVWVEGSGRVLRAGVLEVRQRATLQTNEPNALDLIP